MDNQNYLFYEEFTKLNQICVSIYQMENGVRDYMAEMVDVSSIYWETIPYWKEDLDQLYRYQMTYGALAQNSDAFREYLCNQEDVDWLRQFRTRIMDRKDPLALLLDHGYRAEDDARQRLEDERSGEIVYQTMNPHDRYINGPLAVWILLIAVVLTCVICVLILSQGSIDL